MRRLQEMAQRPPLLRLHYKRMIWLSAAVFWMALIFYFSSQKAAESGEISQTLAYRMTAGLNNLLSLEWEEGMLRETAEWLEHPLRKAAHMTEYAILAWILLGNCMQYPALKKKAYLWAEAGAAFYAATDEFHQLFVEGRSGEIRDAAIDSLGAFLGLLTAWAALSVYYKKR